MTTAKSSRRARNINFVELHHPELEEDHQVLTHMSDAAKSGQVVYSAQQPCCKTVADNISIASRIPVLYADTKRIVSVAD